MLFRRRPRRGARHGGRHADPARHHPPAVVPAPAAERALEMPPAAGPTQVPDQPVAEGAVRLGFADGSGVTLASGDPYAAALRRVAAAMLGR